MRKLKTAYPFPAVLLAATLVSCSMDWGARTSRPMLPDVPDQAGLPGTLPSSMVLEYYVAGVEYPPGYDWVRDPQYGTVDCTMFLMKDGERILEFGVGYGYGVSPDADMSRCIGDHIYTDYSTSGETVIRKDGQELFRYPGREMLEGFILQDSTVIYTLGVPREGDGWAFRKNGTVVCSSDAGLPVTGLYMDGDVPVFGYKVPENDFHGRKEAFFIVRDGVPREVPSEGKEIVDFLQHGGVLHVLYLDQDGKACLSSGDVAGELALPEGALLHSLDGLQTDSLAVYTLGEIETAGGEIRNVLWKGMEIREIFDAEVSVTACYPDGDRLGATGHRRDEWASPVYFLDGEYTFLEPGYGFVSGSFADFSGGHFCLLLLPEESGRPPVYVVDGKTFVVDINGYLFSIGRLWTESPS